MDHRRKDATSWEKRLARRRAGVLLVGLGLVLSPVSVRPAVGSHGELVVAPIEWVRRLVESGERPLLVDLRPSEDYRNGRLPGARSVPLGELSRRYAEIPQPQRVVLYCACPRQELEGAYRFLLSKGYENASVMLEGFTDWVSRGYPVER